MELTPQLLTDEVEFRETFRGYDRNEVDDFLERVAVAVGQLQAQLGEAVGRAKAAEARASGAPAPAEPAAERAAPSAEDPTEELRRTLVLAQRTADAAIREAHQEADQVVDDARAQAEQMIREARAEAERESLERRREIRSEVDDYERNRSELEADVTTLDQHLGAQRDQVLAAIAELQRVVDDPDSLKPLAPPELSERPDDQTTPPSWQDDDEPLVTPPPEPVPAAERRSAAVPLAAAGVDEATGAHPVAGELAAESIPAPAEYAALPGAPDAEADDPPDSDAFLTELRKAMHDDEPLGPRDVEGGLLFDQDDTVAERPRSRFGRRR